jgi:hypothetical protein
METARRTGTCTIREVSVPMREKGNTTDVTTRILDGSCEQYIPSHDLGGEEYHHRKARRKRSCRQPPCYGRWMPWSRCPTLCVSPCGQTRLADPSRGAAGVISSLGLSRARTHSAASRTATALAICARGAATRHEGARKGCDVTRLAVSTCHVLSRASARVGRVAGPLGGIPHADQGRDLRHRRPV